MASSLVPLYLFSSLIAAAGQITQVNMWEVAQKGFCMYTVLHQCSKCRRSQPPHQRGPMARSHICTLCCKRIHSMLVRWSVQGREGLEPKGYGEAGIWKSSLVFWNGLCFLSQNFAKEEHTGWLGPCQTGTRRDLGRTS